VGFPLVATTTASYLDHAVLSGASPLQCSRWYPVANSSRDMYPSLFVSMFVDGVIVDISS
jgi:hypothetical protein